MKVGIDARMVDNLGIGTYIKGIIQWLPKLSNYKYVLFGNSKRLEFYNLPVVEFDCPIYGLKEQVLFPGVIKKAGIDLLHLPHYNAPLFLQQKKVVTIHDLIHLIYPEYLPSKKAYFYARFMIGQACKNAEIIIADSQSTKNDIVKYFNIAPSKIKVIYLGYSRDFRQSSEKAAKSKLEYGKYLLYVGAIRPHKNVLNFIDAFYMLKQEKNIENKLIIVGKGKPPYIDEVRKKINSYNLGDEVLIFENVPQKKLVELYCGAELFVFLSFYEGFGLPPLEAMACGCPVITSNAASLPEVAGEAGIMIDPYNIDEMKQSIYRVLTESELRRQMIEKGLRRVKLFSWEKTVKKTLEIYGAAVQ